jgi:hypothetical protein
MSHSPESPARERENDQSLGAKEVLSVLRRIRIEVQYRPFHIGASIGQGA